MRVLTDKLGSLTDTGSYDAYGNVINPLSAEFGYRGESFDDLTRLQYLRARYYEPGTGRFLGVDPFEGDVSNPVSRHRYLYGNSNPVSYSDPSGQFSLGEVLEALTVYGTLTALQTVVVRGLYGNPLFGTSDQDQIEWTGTYASGSFALPLLGPFGFAGGGGYMKLEAPSGNNEEYTQVGEWIVLGAGLTLGPVPFSATWNQPDDPTSLTSIKSPRRLGADPNVLGGGFISLSANIIWGGGVGASAVISGLGVGYLSVSSSVGIDVSLTAFTGLSIPLYPITPPY